MIGNVALIPPAGLASRLILASQALGAEQANGALLGPNARPHITVLQIELSEQQPSGVLPALLEQLPFGASWDGIVFGGLALLPTSDGELWVEIPVLKSLALSTLQTVIAGRAARIGRLMSAVEDLYRPHVTLAYYAGGYPEGLIPMPNLVVREESSGWRLAVGVSGPNYTFEDVLSAR